MIELNRVLRQIEGGGDFVQQMREFDMEDELAEWQFGLSKLENVWEIIRCLDEVGKEVLAERIVSLFDVRSPVFVRFAQMSQGDNYSFEEMLIQTCGTISCLGELATGLYKIDMGATTACLVPCEKEGFVELSLRMKGLSPSEFLAELAVDLEILKRSQDGELRRKNIVAYSWLLDMRKKKTEKILNSLGIGPANGAKIFTLDPNEILAGSVETTLPEADLRHVLVAAATAIPLAEVNIDRFLRHGKLPRVGVLTMEASDFWK